MTLYPKKRQANTAMAYIAAIITISIVVVCIVGIVFAYNHSPVAWWLLGVVILLGIWYTVWSVKYAWWRQQIISIQNKKLVVKYYDIVQPTKGSYDEYIIGVVKRIRFKKNNMILDVEDSTAQSKPFKAKLCKKVVIYDYTPEVVDYVRKFAK